METPTPISTRRVTRSQSLASSGNKNTNIPMSKKVVGTDKGAVKSSQKTGKQQDRFVLMDISNDSPIVGLAMGSLETPSSTVSKKRSCSKKSDTPASGETLLRGQVKTLLQKVDEEAVMSKISICGVNGPFHPLKSLVNSPMGLLAPTHNNTPHVSNLFGNANEENNGLESAISKTVIEIDEQKKEESDESDKLITRSLLFDFSEKSESSCDSMSDCTSVLTYQESNVKSSTDDNSSIWSIQVNASSKDDEEEDAFEDEVVSEKEEDEYYDEEEDCRDDDASLDDLCEGLNKFSVNGVEFAGKHTRFVYNSDDELEGGEECDDADEEGLDSLANGVLRLKGMPTPKGKHLRFPMDD